MNKTAYALWSVLLTSLFFISACQSGGSSRIDRKRYCKAKENAYVPLELKKTAKLSFPNSKASDPNADTLPPGVYRYSSAELFFREDRTPPGSDAIVPNLFAIQINIISETDSLGSRQEEVGHQADKGRELDDREYKYSVGCYRAKPGESFLLDDFMVVTKFQVNEDGTTDILEVMNIEVVNDGVNEIKAAAFVFTDPLELDSLEKAFTLGGRESQIYRYKKPNKQGASYDIRSAKTFDRERNRVAVRYIHEPPEQPVQ
jgi:hypothetical protein